MEGSAPKTVLAGRIDLVAQHFLHQVHVILHHREAKLLPSRGNVGAFSPLAVGDGVEGADGLPTWIVRNELELTIDIRKIVVIVSGQRGAVAAAG